LKQLRVQPAHRVVVDVGCGTGHAVKELVRRSADGQKFVGIEPAEQMRQRACRRLQPWPNVEITEGRFEELPVDTNSVDYLFSILAFHWTSDVNRSVAEIARVLKPRGEMDLFFTGRHTGREFTRKTTPIFLRHLGPNLLKSATMRQHLTADATLKLFSQYFDEDRLSVTESKEVHFDDLAGHWSWWFARAAGHFQAIPEQQRRQCDEEIREAISQLEGDRGIPYTVHLIHVSLTHPIHSESG
jgi:ubiquinone/menaquinone biosynthesis C-methylase UbiE